MCLRLLDQPGLEPDTSVINIGGFHLVDRLLADSIREIAVLNVATTALETSPDRLKAAEGGRPGWNV
jgi:hypothetical protein